jgi:lysophospholipase L1-like esterase
VGGLERLEREILPFGKKLGLDVAIHNGRTRGGGSARLVALVQRTDVVIIVTGTNSHGAVQIARREAVKSGARVRLLKFLGASTARALLTEIAQQAAA